jgi:propionate CoA-transferase
MAGIFREAFALNGSATFSRLWSFLRWKLSWNKRDLYGSPNSLSGSKFVSAMEAIKLIPDNAVVASSGFAGCGICNLLFWAIKESYQRNNSPKNLTLMNVGAQGGRGKIPGSVEELAESGLLIRYIAGHLETAKNLLKLGEEGKIELHTLPQGIISRLFARQAEQIWQLTTPTGIGTFLDPTIGGGSAVTPQTPNRFVTATDDDQLSYHLPVIEMALLSAPYADQQGNLYFHGEPLISENYEVVKAARANGGKVIAMVGEIIDQDASKICISSDQVDAIAIHANRPQMAGVPRQHPLSALLPGSNVPPNAAMSLIRLINRVAGITPERSVLDDKLARMAVDLFLKLTIVGSVVNFGVGLPEEVCRFLLTSNKVAQFKLTTEAGTYGGIPAPGIFFGTAVNPERIESSAWMFNLYQSNLDTTVLGFLQVDSAGNVNVSKRGDSVVDFVGPGGFCDITQGAKTIIFVGSWMVGGEYDLQGGELQIIKPGKSKFVKQVDHITFNAQQAVKQNKRVYYITDVGIFKLTTKGLQLCEAVAGIDIEKDIVKGCGADIIVPST